VATSLTILCTNAWFIAGCPIHAELDGNPAFLTWDRAARFDVAAGAHGVDIWHTPPSSLLFGGKANKLSRSVELNDGFHYTLVYGARLAPMLPPKVTLTVDRMK
jgi:hypothetical protein